MTPTDIRLFLDIRNAAELGKTGVFNWWLVNTGPQLIAAVRVDLQQSSPSPGITLSSCVRERLNHVHDAAIKCPSSYMVHQAGFQSLGVRLQVTLANGTVQEWVSQQEALFDFSGIDTKGQTVINIEGAALMKSPPPPGSVVNIKGDALLNWNRTQAADASDQSLNVNADGSVPDAEHLRELQLCLPRAHGLGPLDLAQFWAYWKDLRRDVVADLAFVYGSKDRGGPFSEPRDPKAPDRSDLFKVRLSSYKGGHVTLISRGTSRHFRIMAPSTQGGLARISANQVVHWPGELLPEITFHGETYGFVSFMHPGEEQVLAVVTDQPLIQPVDIVHGEMGNPQFSMCSAEMVIALLEQALARREAEVGFDRVIVVQG